MNIEGKDYQRITYLNSENTNNPVWSSDMDTIFFNSDGKILAVDMHELKTRIIYTSNEYVLVKPRISQNVEKMIFIAKQSDGSEKRYLYMLNRNGTNLHRIIDDDNITSCDWTK